MYEKLELAIRITTNAFMGKYDKGGMPYILHCLHVMNVVAKKTDKDSDLMQIAVMHDLVEDTFWTIEDLKAEGFCRRVLNGVHTMTHERSVTYVQYIDNISSSKDATIVKLVDLKHNMDPTRMKGLREKDFARIEKYHKAYAYLTTYV